MAKKATSSRKKTRVAKEDASSTKKMRVAKEETSSTRKTQAAQRYIGEHWDVESKREQGNEVCARPQVHCAPQGGCIKVIASG